MYSPELLDHFQHPRNAGTLENADAVVRVENPVCGDVLELYVKVEEKRIVEIRFKAKGCVPSMACGSAITELAKGKSIETAREFRIDDVLRKVGGVPETSKHAGVLAVDALRAALKSL
ncbi:MAG TPA: iron-sulfur cluster assembly scaffold protein [Terriglobales bacterium]|nr:iron-sulfur cluster assembly scaffold protein [Terriglobales bacterium]